MPSTPDKRKEPENLIPGRKRLKETGIVKVRLKRLEMIGIGTPKVKEGRLTQEKLREVIKEGNVVRIKQELNSSRPTPGLCILES